MVTGYSYYRCPKCGHHLGWFQRCKLAPWGVRKVIPCPSCKEPLVWSKWPHRMLDLWVLLAIAVGNFGYHSKFWLFAGSISLVAALMALCFLKIEISSQSKSSN